MGNDAPLAILSRNRKLMPDYFKQLFAQVRLPAPPPPLRDRLPVDRARGRLPLMATDVPVRCGGLLVASCIRTQLMRRMRPRRGAHRAGRAGAD